VFSVVRAAAVSDQKFGKQVPAAMDTNATIEELFSMWSVPRCYNQDSWSKEQARSKQLGGGQAYDRSGDYAAVVA
jgi:hypothetical protein